MSYRLLPLLAAVCLLALPACATAAMPKEVRAILDGAESIELYSLDPNPLDREKKGFHDWKVLGKMTLKEKKDREKLLAALYKGVNDSDGTVAGCFLPRHGIRAAHGGKTVDLVICFQCLSMQVWMADKKTHSVLTTAGPRDAFNKVLTDAKVPLPKQAE